MHPGAAASMMVGTYRTRIAGTHIHQAKLLTDGMRIHPRLGWSSQSSPG
jgi:hypothetical protein